MKTIYLDTEFRCHVLDDKTKQSIETDFFDGKCDAYIEGYRFVPDGESWIREDGTVFWGEMIAPWKPYRELAAAQAEYEKAQEEISLLQTELIEVDTALLDATYKNIIGSIE